MPDNYRGMQFLTESPDEGALNWDGQHTFTVGGQRQASGASMSGPAPSFSRPMEPEQARAHTAPASKRAPEQRKMSESELMEWADKAIAKVRKDEERSMSRGPAVNAEGTGYAQGLPQQPVRAPRMPAAAPVETAPVMMPRNDASLPTRQLEASKGMGGSKVVTVPNSQARFEHPSLTIGRTGQEASQALLKNDKFQAAVKEAEKQPGYWFLRHGAQAGIEKAGQAKEWADTHKGVVPFAEQSKRLEGWIDGEHPTAAPYINKADDFLTRHSTTLQDAKMYDLDAKLEDYQKKLEEAKKKAPRDEGEVD